MAGRAAAVAGPGVVGTRAPADAPRDAPRAGTTAPAPGLRLRLVPARLRAQAVPAPARPRDARGLLRRLRALPGAGGPVRLDHPADAARAGAAVRGAARGAGPHRRV